MKRTITILGSWVAVLVLGCGGSQPPPESAPGPAPAPLPAAPIETTPPEPTPEAPPAEPAPPAPVARWEGLSTPESVLYDPDADRYLVSNINGSPVAADNNGYISELSPEGTITKEKLIAGGAGGVKLNAPKGLGIFKGILYVSDVTVVRKFDVKTGAAKGDIPIAGTAFLNDIAIAPDGRVFVSDSGLKLGEKGLEPMGADAVYVIEKGKARPLAKTTSLGGPNGLCWTDQGLWVVTFGSGELYRLDDQGERQDVVKLPTGGLDGIVCSGPSFLIASWAGSQVFTGPPAGPFEVAVSGTKSPADIGFDAKRRRVLVPRFLENVVEAYQLP